MLRRGGATALEASKPGSSSRHLGHLSAGVAARHYLDKRFIDRAKPLVPSLIDDSATLDDGESGHVQDGPVSSAAEMQAMLTTMLERVAAVPHVGLPLVPSVPVDAVPAPYTLSLLDQFTATEFVKMSVVYRRKTKNFLRQTIEALEMWRTSDFSGQRFAAFLDGIKADKSKKVSDWFRFPLLRFLKWLAKRDDETGRIAAECAGRLAIMLPSTPRPRTGGKGRKAGKEGAV